MKNYFEDKVVWVTGASSGIGEALVMKLATQNAKIILSARRESVLQEVQKKANLTSENSLILPLDLSDSTHFKDAVESGLEKFGRIDILINNAGISQRSAFLEMQSSVFERVMQVNFFGQINLTRHVLPVMLKQKEGSIVTISSISGKLGTPMRTAYCASKHALHGFFDSLRAEHQKDNLQFLLVCPGYIRTNLSYHAVLGNGQNQGVMDKNQEKGMLPEKCASKILHAIQTKKIEIYPAGTKETLGLLLKRFFPKLLTKIVALK